MTTKLLKKDKESERGPNNLPKKGRDTKKREADPKVRIKSEEIDRQRRSVSVRGKDLAGMKRKEASTGIDRNPQDSRAVNAKKEAQVPRAIQAELSRRAVLAID